ncbi:MAG: TlpA disulfide reductase family protein [Phycisphaerae bacterium]
MRTAIIGGSIAVAIAMVISASSAASAAASSPAPAAKESTQQIAVNVEAAQFKSLKKIAETLHGASIVDVLQSKSLTAKFGPKLTPILGTVVTAFDQGMVQRPELKPFFTGARDHYLAIMAVLGDQSALARLSAQAKSAHPFRNLLARMYLQQYMWLTHQHDPAAQQKVIDTLRAIAVKHPMNEDMVQLLMSIRHLGAADTHVANQAGEIVLKVLKSPAAQQYQQMAAMKTAQNKHLNHHAVFEGVLLGSGKPFSTKSLIGHVVLVDTWATWCPPCRASIPHVESLYSKLHKKGFDVIGVSLDANPKALKTFLAQHKKMTWPQMYDVNNPGNLAIARAYGITAIPTQFILDRKGVLRYIITGYDPQQVTKDIKKMMSK